MIRNAFTSHSARTRPKWIFRSLVLLIAILCTAREAASQPAQNQAAQAEAARKLAISQRRAHPLRLRDVQFFNMTKTGAHLSEATTSFDVNTVVFAGWAITFDNRLFGLDSGTHRVDATYVGPDGRTLGTINDIQMVSRNMKTVTFTGHVGNSHGGAFLPGTYTVNFSLDGKPVAAKNFEVELSN
jgi:hypothetical protein